MGFCYLWFCLKRSPPQNDLYAMRYALCFTEMAEDRLEKCM